MSKLILTLLLATTTSPVQCQNEAIQFKRLDLVNGDACVSVHNSVKQNGVCMPIQSCDLILADVRKKKFNHTVCGYEDKKQIVCCPTSSRHVIKLRIDAELNLGNNLDCDVANTNETGVMKFLADCPAINKNDAAAHINKFCTDDVCSDLVCCPPLKQRRRLKEVCWNVDHPRPKIELRLLLNQECTVDQLNIKGRFQRDCDYAERNPELKSLLQRVCNHHVCDNWYCCPIKDGGEHRCTANSIRKKDAKFVGPKCVDSKSGLSGTCKPSYDCQHHNVLTLDECGTYCCNDFYCCPEEVIPINQLISVTECKSYTNYLSREVIEVPMFNNLKKCHSFDSLGAGGTAVQPGEFPHMAALGYKINKDIFWYCGGSLISDRYVLTAGHCLKDRHLGPVQKVRLGVVELSNDIDTSDCPEDFGVAKLIAHPEYNPKFVYNDIGLIELVAQVKFNFYIRPICLPPDADVTDDLISMGWGSTGFGKEPSVHLLKVNQNLFTYDECSVQYSYGRRYPKGITNDTHICAGSRFDNQSTCTFDSGGPLLVHHFIGSQLFYIYGIVSFGTTCGFSNSPGVYIKVFPYLSWIEKVV